MNFQLRANSRLRRDLGETGTEFLVFGLAGITRILPHMEVANWKIEQGEAKSSAKFADASRRELKLLLGLRLGEKNWKISGRLWRRKVPSGVGAISRTIDLREIALANAVVTSMARTLGPKEIVKGPSLRALRSGFDERVVAEHLVSRYELGIDIGNWFSELRRLAEQTYENRSITFGSIVDTVDKTSPVDGAVFPADFFEKKKFRVLSDGYRTMYRVSGRGALLGFHSLEGREAVGSRYYPEWCEDLAAHAHQARLGIALTRQGDILVLEDGHLTFTYRLGRWQYWNHSHLVDLLRNAARVQHVLPRLLSPVVRSIYRAALDVSFRRSGGLFVLLRNRASLGQIVRKGEALQERDDAGPDQSFDLAWGRRTIQSTPRRLIAALASVDGAVVLSNKGALLAYGAVLEPKRKGRTTGEEGSRTKAAIGASNYGLALKVSSDGGITVYSSGDELITV